MEAILKKQGKTSIQDKSTKYIQKAKYLKNKINRIKTLH